MQLNAFFASVGGDYEQVLTRLPSEDMIRRFLRKFPGDPSYRDLKAALEGEDMHAAFCGAHSLKGICANRGLDALAAAASDLTEALRNASELPPRKLVFAVDAAYQTVIHQIEQLDC